MKPLEVYKDAVMNRVEDKKRARKRAVRRTLAVCLPLCLCLGIVGATVLPHALRIGEDYASGTNGDAFVEYPDATVWQGNTVIAVMDDADAAYATILALYESDGNLTGNSYGGVNDLTDGADVESFSEAPSDSGSENGSAPYYLHFTRPEGERVFRLQNNVLTDLTSGSTVFITEEQAQALIQGKTP